MLWFMCALTKVLESEFKWKVYITCFNSIKSTSAISRVYAIETHSALLLEFCEQSEKGNTFRNVKQKYLNERKYLLELVNPEFETRRKKQRQ